MTKSLLSLGLVIAFFGAGSCVNKEQAEKPARSAEKSAPKSGLTNEQAARVLVKLGARTVTLGQFAERLGRRSAYQTARYNGSEGRREFLNEMVRFELLAMEAEKRGYDRRTDVERVKQQAMVEQMMQELFDERGLKLSDISEAEIQKYYADHKGEFEAQRRTVPAARGVIQNRLWLMKREAAIQKFVADLRSKARVRENRELLGKVRVEVQNR